jgi:hypothetical protein
MTLDGVLNESIWGQSSFVAIANSNCNYGTGCGATDTGASAQFKAAWNSNGLWIGVVVSDPGVLYADTAAPWNGSGVEIFFDLNNAKAGYNAGTGNYSNANTYQWAIPYNANTVAQYHNPAIRTILAASQATPGSGYTMEIEIPWANLGVTAPLPGSLSGLDVAVDVANAAGNARDHQIVAYNGNFNPFDQTPAQWGAMQYQACNSFTATNTPVYSPTMSFTTTPVVSVTLTPTPTPSPTTVARGATLPYDEYEAEAAAYTGSLVGPSRQMAMNGGNLQTEMAAEASGREAVQLSSTGQYVRFTTLRQCNSIVVRYIIPDSAGGGGINATLNCAVTGPGVNFNQALAMTSRYAWDYGNDMGYVGSGGVNVPGYQENPGAGTPFHLYDEVHALFGQEVPAGSTITLAKTAADTAAYYVVDLIDLEDVAPAAAMPAGFVPITNYGAVGDGVTDNSSAIQACLNANTRIWIPQGNFASLSASFNVPAGRTVRGAGMWYSTISGYYNTMNLNGSNTVFSDFLLSGDTTNRDDNSPDTGFNNGGGTGSSITNVWVEHEKNGYWMNAGNAVSNGMLITGCRFRDTYADGLNFNQGSSNCTVTQCNFRNNGDDAIASWSQAGFSPNTNNTISYNTIQCPWRADGIAFNGGNSNSVLNNVISDTLQQAGIDFDYQFGPTAFTGNDIISNNTLNRCGAQYGGGGQQYGAIYFWGNQGPLSPGTFTLDGNTINSATFMAIGIDGPNYCGGETFSNSQINNPGTYGIQITGNANGSAMFSTTVVTAPGTAGLLNGAGGAFIVNRGAGDVGW